jgi:hypothetical protein
MEEINVKGKIPKENEKELEIDEVAGFGFIQANNPPKNIKEFKDIKND